MAYIKGIFIQDIFSNSSNGYMVGLIRVKESDISDKVNKVITFTGIFDELKEIIPEGVAIELKKFLVARDNK